MAETRQNPSNLPVPQGKVPGDVPASPFAFANPPTQQPVGPSNIQSSPFAFANPPVPQGAGAENAENNQRVGGNNVPINPFFFQNPNLPPQQPLPPAPLIGTLTNQYHRYLPLTKAISKGDLAAVKSFLNRWPEASKAIILYTGHTALHFACNCGRVEIVKTLLDKMLPEDLESTETAGSQTPLTAVAFNGCIKIAKALVGKNRRLLEFTGPNGDLPVVVAAQAEEKEMTRFLYHETPLDVLLANNGYHGILLLSSVICSKILDVAMDLFEQCPRLAVTQNVWKSTLPILTISASPALFPSGSRLGFWQRFLYACIQVKQPTESKIYHPRRDQSLLKRSFMYLCKLLGIYQVYHLKKTHQLAQKLMCGMSEEAATLSAMDQAFVGIYQGFFFAVKYGTTEFLVEMINASPDLLWMQQTTTRRNLFLLAVEFKQEKIFNLLKGLDERKDALISNIDAFGNGMLHLAGFLAPPSKLAKIPGAALQMQRELQWFKEVESIVPDLHKERLNTMNATPREVFSQTHKLLQQEAEKWMKDTATSCSLVAALIVTVTFAAAFTVPGGTDDTMGLPIRIRDTRFMVFTVSNIISFFSSCTSVLIFLGMLTARYSEEDFLKSLPTKMIAGLSILFISIAAMLVAFSSALFTLLHNKSWIVIPVILIACLPVILFVLLQYPLLAEMIVSTYGRGIFGNKMKRWI